jgi:hypothetical protein
MDSNSDDARHAQLQSDLADLSALSLADLRALADMDISPGMARILRDIDEVKDAVAGFQSAL